MKNWLLSSIAFFGVSCAMRSPPSSFIDKETRAFLDSMPTSAFCSIGSLIAETYISQENVEPKVKDLSKLLSYLQSSTNNAEAKSMRERVRKITVAYPVDATVDDMFYVDKALSCGKFGRFTIYQALAKHDFSKTTSDQRELAIQLLKNHLDSRISGPEVSILPILLRLAVLTAALGNRSLPFTKSKIKNEVAAFVAELKTTNAAISNYLRAIPENDYRTQARLLRPDFELAQSYEDRYMNLIAQAW
ncbi:MAG: hypothetical protein ABIR96_11115 [Bdellovibrionota bacterium]